MKFAWAGAITALAMWSSTSLAQQAQSTTSAQPAAEVGKTERPAKEAGGISEKPPGAAQAAPATTPAAEVTRFFERLHPNLFGYLKLGYFYVLSPTENALIGSNSGFRLINARLGLSLRPVENLETVITLDAANPQRRDTDPLEGSRVVLLRDGFMEFRASRFLHLRGGQFKPPFDGEELLPDDSLPFITRSIVSDGMLPPEGPTVAGLALERQVGIQGSSERLGGDLGFQYAVAVVNGNGPNVLNNDNNAVAPIGRLSLLYRDIVSVSVNGFYNPRTLGERPARVRETQVGYGGDVAVNVAGLNAFAMVIGRNISHGDTGIPSEQSLGFVGWAKYFYEPVGIEGGVRFAYLEPSNEVPDDARTELTAMVGYRLKDFPARILLQATFRGEQPGAQVDNNSLDALAQVTF